MTRRTLFTLIAVLCLVVAGTVTGRMAWFYLSIPSSNTALTHFDTLIVLGNPCNSDGTPGPEQRERVLESVRQYQQGIAPRIIMSGGAAHNQWIEADSMKKLAVSQGVPADAILEDTKAQNTIDNIVNSSAIMVTQGWHSAEVVSSPSHLPRAALILQHYTTIAWRTDASRWPPEYHFAVILAIYASEIKDCWQIHTNGFAARRRPAYAPALSTQTR
ncbi:YdcF family protein [Granulicella sp. 5B5]|uniref:YdcF family protein n=1 Tax=Granulicella sp. 5B5 TaxID=1617967 RepID=UPI002102F2EE|nr:YdcF family protein [Granulicella sp. 5B5]